MRRLAFAAALLLSTAAVAASSAPPRPAAAAAGHALGIDLAGIDKGLQPGDDFDNTPMAHGARRRRFRADRSSTGAFLKVVEVAEQRKRR